MLKINTKKISKQAKVMMAGLMSMAVIGGIAPSISHGINMPSVNASRIKRSYRYYEAQLKSNQKKLHYAQKKHYTHWAKKLRSVIRYDARHAKRPARRKPRVRRHVARHQTLTERAKWFYKNAPKINSSRISQTDAYKKGYNNANRAEEDDFSDGDAFLYPTWNSKPYYYGWVIGMTTSEVTTGNDNGFSANKIFREHDENVNGYKYAIKNYDNGMYFAHLHGYTKVRLPAGSYDWYATKKQKKITSQHVAQNKQNQSNNTNSTVNF